MQTQSTHKNFRAKGTKRLLTYLAYSVLFATPMPRPNLPNLGDSFLRPRNCVQVLSSKKNKMSLITRPEIAQLRLNKTAVVTRLYIPVYFSFLKCQQRV